MAFLTLNQMKSIGRYFAAAAMTVVLASSCKDIWNPEEIIKANPGDEVVFGVALPGGTKTVYGDEIANEDGTNPRFPIYWVNGDLVKVASPQCMSGRNSAEYSVAVESETQNYATSLTKTGEAGVQWGEAATADFYSIYPSTAGTELTVSGENVVAKLHVDATQFASTKDLGTSYYAQPADMGNVIMYAKTAGVPSGKTVELHYTPFSTVLEFELTAPDTYQGNQKSEITIQSITLVAPEGTTIAGDFAFNFPTAEIPTPSVAAAAGGNNAITLHFLDNNKYTTVLSTTKQTLKAKMCVMPISGVKYLSGWKVEVATSAGTFSKNLTDQTGELKPGLVHKIHLPKLNYASEEWKYDIANWIPSLPDYRNIYLSEVSLPGAWYAGSTEDYQSTSDISTLWNAGVRAFAVETRTVSTNTIWAWQISSYGVPDGVVISGSQSNSSYTYAFGTNSLHTDAQSDASVCYGGTSISGTIETLANLIAADGDEYGVLVLSYADGGKGGRRYVDFGAWLNMLYNIYNALSADVKGKIYSKPITANTTVNDVLGKLILKINIDADIAKSGTIRTSTFTYDNNLPALFSYNPFLPQMGNNVDFTVPYFSDLHWSTWEDSYRNFGIVSNSQGATRNGSEFVWVFSSANRTQLDSGKDTSIPTYAQRKSALGAMMEYSKKIYDESTHNVWFYFNCGGTEATSLSSTSNSPTVFATEMNNWLLNTAIANKTEASPLGIVMFNQCTSDTYNGPAIVKAIIEMNSKFYLKHAGTSGSGTGGTQTNQATNDATFANGGDAF